MKLTELASKKYLSYMTVIYIFLIGLIGYLGYNHFMAKDSTGKAEVVKQDVGDEEPAVVKESDYKKPAVTSKPSPKARLITKKIDAAYHDYQFKYPNDWDFNIESNEFATTVELTKGSLKLSIMQGQIGGAECIFPDGDRYYDENLGPHSKYEDYVEFEGIEGTFRRVEYGDLVSEPVYFVCIKSRNIDSYLAPTEYGLIEYDVPDNTSEAELKEMDNIVKTLSST